MSKKCPNCGRGIGVYQDYVGGTSFFRCDICGHTGCDFEDATLFDRITRSVEVLAESSVYFEEKHTLAPEGSDCGVTFSGGWTSPFIEYKYGTKPEAIAATIERLKEVNDE